VHRLPRLVVAALAAGCVFDGDERAIDAVDPAQLVLQRSHLPGFGLEWSAGNGRRWTRRYRRPALSVQSTVEISPSSHAAEARFSAAREAFPESGGWQPIGEPGLGAESFASTRVEGGARSYEVVWREANVTARLGVNGREGHVPFADALELAEMQEELISEAKR
jgi:hypothetical protein